MNIQAAILDVDGTLLDSLSIWDTIGEDYLRSLGIVPRKDLSETIRDMSMAQAARYFQEEYHLDKSKPEIIGGINQMLEDFYLNTVPLKPEAKELLAFLKENRIRMTAATATDRKLVQAALKRNGVLEDFERIFTCSEIGHGKDEPHIYEEAARFLQTKKEDILVFEDALYAIRTAKKAGFHTVAIYDCHEPDWETAGKEADLSLKSSEDLEKLKKTLSN